MEKHVETTWSELKFLLEGLECYKDTQMIACLFVCLLVFSVSFFAPMALF